MSAAYRPPSLPKGRGPVGRCRTGSPVTAVAALAPTTVARPRDRRPDCRLRQTGRSPSAARPPGPRTDCDADSAVPRASRPPIGNARVEPGVDNVEDQCREAERDDDDEHDALDHKMVVLADRLEEQRANTGITENHFDQHRAREYLAERQRQGGNLRQDGVAQAVAQKDRRRLQ